MEWQFFEEDNRLQFMDHRFSHLYWINLSGDIFHLNYSSDLFNLDTFDIIDISEDLDYLKFQAEKHYKEILEYIV